MKVHGRLQQWGLLALILVIFLAVWFAAKSLQAAPSSPPQVVSLSPANGATGVAPGTVEAAITFDQPMFDAMSLTTRGGPGKFPELAGKPSWSADKKTLTATMKLAANHEYVIGINGEQYMNFKNENGVPLEPIIWQFTTGN